MCLHVLNLIGNSLNTISFEDFHDLFLFSGFSGAWLDRAEGGLKFYDGVLAVVEVCERFPGGFFKGITNPLDKVVSHVVDAAALEYFLNFPLLMLVLHEMDNRGNLILLIKE